MQRAGRATPNALLQRPSGPATLVTRPLRRAVPAKSTSAKRTGDSVAGGRAARPPPPPPPQSPLSAPLPLPLPLPAAQQPQRPHRPALGHQLLAHDQAGLNGHHQQQHHQQQQQQLPPLHHGGPTSHQPGAVLGQPEPHQPHQPEAEVYEPSEEAAIVLESHISELPSHLPHQEWAWKGAKLRNAAAAVAMGAAVRFLVPVPEGLDPQAWSLLGFFVATVAGLVLEPLPAGAWAIMCTGAALGAKVLTFDEAFAAADSPVLWLIVSAFFLARGFERTGLGERIAELLVRAFGGSTRSLALSLALGEAALSPGMPSTTARAAGIFAPVIKSVSAAGGSYPDDDESRKRIGAYLTMSQLQSCAHSSSMFLTASAQNLLCMQLAEACGVDVGNHFLTWAEGAAVPAIVGTLVTPYLVYLLLPPTVSDTPEAPQQAAKRLEQLGKLTQDESVMIAAVAGALVLWVFGDEVGIPPVSAAVMAVGVLLGSGVLSWREDCLKGSPQAWDLLCWFTILVSMSLALQQHGVIGAFTDWASSHLLQLGMGTWALFGSLHVIFFALHYMFASQTAHVGALYAGFLSLMLASGVPPKLAAMSLAYNACLQGGLTHYASSQAAVHYASGFVKLREIFGVGAATGAAALGLWATVGMGWWRILGWY